MADEREMIEHTVEIDEYASAVLRIPKQMTAIDLKGLTSKATKLFNLAEVPIKPKRRYVRSGKYSNGKSKNGRHRKYSDKFVQRICKLLETKSYREVAGKLGMRPKILYDLVRGRTGKNPSEFRK